MVAPFCGCTFGGWLYDVFLYTGVSPINTPWMGLKRFFHPTRATWSNKVSPEYV
jgi:aquaglyceroporin related protein